MSSKLTKAIMLFRAVGVKGLTGVARSLGAEVVPVHRWNGLMTQRDRLFAKAVMAAPADERDAPPLHGIIFSMNRPLQLHGLVSSYFGLVQNAAPLTVLYRATTEDYARAYEEAAQELAGYPVQFVREQKFRPDLLQVLSSVRSKRMFFFTDDDIFIRPFDMAQVVALDLTNAVFSFRHGRNLSYCYNRGSSQPLPPYTIGADGFLRWRWREGLLDWNYPMSVDGHVFLRSEMLLIASVSNFSAPNTFEDAMALFKSLFDHREGVCFEESRLVNIPANKVQTENKNFAGNTSADWLLSQWQKGFRLDWKRLTGHPNRGVHEEIAMPLAQMPS